jgi:hypothetical protein
MEQKVTGKLAQTQAPKPAQDTAKAQAKPQVTQPQTKPNISEHVSYAEATATTKNAPNVPNAEQLQAMKLVSAKIFERTRAGLGNSPITIDSFFRSLAVNELVPGSSNTSQHCKGEAIDMKAPAGAKFTNADIFNYIKKNLKFDQLIWEFGTSTNPDWVHCSYSASHLRNQALKSVIKSGKRVYLPYA